MDDSIEAWQALLHPDDRPRQQQAIADHLRGGSEDYKVEYRLRDASGNWRFPRAGAPSCWNATTSLRNGACWICSSA